jgi:hypothetical protein
MRRVLGMILVVGSLAVSGVVSAAVRPADHDRGGHSCYSTCATRTELHIQPDRVLYGDEQSVVFSVFVHPRMPWVPGTPTGTVNVMYQTQVLCSITLSSGFGTCSPTSNALPAQDGRPYCIFAAYGGDTSFSASNSRLRALRVTDGEHHHHHHHGWGD